ncbi:MAG: hypothetical protein JXR73_06555 [Candidatus Omnitrophica bacterium]|nr:hypothetical protein [Candidatus Omnitrophota bacterium]
MRFLQIMLSAVWAAFGWLCFSAMQWQAPIEAPWHVDAPLEDLSRRAFALQTDSETLLNREIQNFQIFLTQTETTGAERADAHAALAFSYWLKAYLQDTYVRQNACLKLALKETRYVLDFYKEKEFSGDRLINLKIAQFYYNAADLLHQMKIFEEAEDHYLEAMRRYPGNPQFYRRYSEMLEESGLPPKIDYDTYFRRSETKRRPER